MCAKLCTKYTVIGTWTSTTLHMSRNSNTHFISGALLDLCSHFIGNGRIFCFFFLCFQLFLGKLCILFGNRAFCNCQNGKSFSIFASFVDCLHYFIDIIWDLRDQNDISTACHTGMKRKPANFVSHDFNDKYTVVRSCCSMDAVNNSCRNVQCALETKGNICTINIIVDCLRQMNDIQPFLPKQICCFLCAISTKDHQTVKAQFMIGMLHCSHFIQPVLIRYTHIFKRLTGCSEYCSAFCQNSGKIFRCQQTIIPIN